MPSASIGLWIVDGVIPPLPQQLAKLLCESRNMGTSVGHVVDFGPQPQRLVIEDFGTAAGRHKIDSDIFLPRPEPQQFHQPGLGTAHAEAADNLEDPDWALLLHAWSPRSPLSARSMFIGDALSAASAAARDGTGSHS